MNPRDYAKASKLEAAENIAREEGRLAAYRDMEERLDPEMYCQSCGRPKTGSNTVHESTCPEGGANGQSR